MADEVAGKRFVSGRELVGGGLVEAAAAVELRCEIEGGGGVLCFGKGAPGDSS
jgi:hypothetical protein